MDILTKILKEFWVTVGQMSPYLLFGFIVAGLISVFISANTVRKHLGGKKLWPITKASLLGIPLPLCSCGVLPVTTSLYKQGASKGASISFLLSTPQTGVDSLALTYSLLGPAFTIIRPITTFLTGIIGGLLVETLDPSTKQIEENNEVLTSSDKKGVGEKLQAALKYAVITLPKDVGKPMLIGVGIAAILSAIIPADFFAGKLGRGLLPMLAMMVIGIPVYVCSSASVPIAAAMMIKGLSPGAALVFLMTGPATNAASFATIYGAFGKKTALIYISTVAICSLIFGAIIDFLAFDMGIKMLSDQMWMMPKIINDICAVVLILLLVNGIIAKHKHAKK